MQKQWTIIPSEVPNFNLVYVSSIFEIFLCPHGSSLCWTGRTIQTKSFHGNNDQCPLFHILSFHEKSVEFVKKRALVSALFFKKRALINALFLTEKCYFFMFGGVEIREFLATWKLVFYFSKYYNELCTTALMPYLVIHLDGL